MSEPEATETSPEGALRRSRRWLGVIVGISALGYAAYAMWHGLSATADALAGFAWGLYVPVLGLTLVNYGLRYLKWHWLLGRVGAHVPHRTNIPLFLSGLAMVITPAKAGELLKPWLVREVTGVPMARTIPVLVTERVTDGIAVVILAAIGVGTYQAESTATLVLTLAVVAAGLAVLAIEPLALGALYVVARLPVVGRVAGKLEEMYRSMRTCVAPVPLLVTVLLSIAAWWAECVGLWLVFRGLDVPASLDVSTFLYASATVLGAPSPGGLGLADAGLVEGARALIPGLPEGTAMAAALLVRVATLWFGVALGALVLLRLDVLVRKP